MVKALQIVGVFASFVLILVGCIAMIGMGIEVDPVKWFYVGCAMVSAGVIFLWFQKQR